MAPMKYYSVMLMLLTGAGVASWAAAETTTPAADAPAAAPAVAEDITEIIIQAPEPRYVAPTRRDKIGRI